MKSIEKAIEKAVKWSKKRGDTLFIVKCDDDEGGPYCIASDEDLETFWAGIPDSNVVCAITGEQIDW